MLPARAVYSAPTFSKRDSGFSIGSKNMAKRVLVVGVNDYSDWSSPVTISGSAFTVAPLQFCVADAKDFCFET
jgi:hypothetical protein